MINYLGIVLKGAIGMKFISWNVNGLRAAVSKGFLDYFKAADADIFSIQETKLQEGQMLMRLLKNVHKNIWTFRQIVKLYFAGSRHVCFNVFS